MWPVHDTPAVEALLSSICNFSFTLSSQILRDIFQSFKNLLQFSAPEKFCIIEWENATQREKLQYKHKSNGNSAMSKIKIQLQMDPSLHINVTIKLLLNVS